MENVVMKTAVTFLIPAYSNLNLLRQFLPSIFREAQTGDTILISEDKVDDYSSQRYFQKTYALAPAEAPAGLGQLWQGAIKLGRKTLTLAFLQRAENGRFARNVNDAVSLVTTDYFILLNSDVALTAGVRRVLVRSAQAASKIFAVGAQEIDVKNGGTCSGRNELWWRGGRFWHRRSSEEDLKQAGATAWVCGGSGIYNTKIWRELGGFDLRYYPAYWEDIDLSFGARRRGYQVLYQPQAVVHHVHETTNDSVFGQQKMQAMSWRGGSKFAWKNGNFLQKLQFLLAYPYWQLKQFPALKLWVLVLCLALGLRVALLDTPHGLTVDEAAIAYNGYGIWTQRRDEWLSQNSVLALINQLAGETLVEENILPLSFRSFGDYKAPLAIYTVGPMMIFFGREIWALRLPFVLAGVGSIWWLMLIVDLLLREVKTNHYTHAAAAGLLMAVLPWHLHFSHLGFENNLALFFVLAGLYGFLCYTRQASTAPQSDWRRCWLSWPLLGGVLSWCLALYSYHSSKIMLPVLGVLLLLVYGRRVIIRDLKMWLLPLLISGVMLAPLIYDSFFGQGLTRASSSFLFQADLSAGQKAELFINGFSRHFTLNYLLGGEQELATDGQGQAIINVRHGDGASGVLTLTVVVLSLLFLAAVSQFKKLSVAERRQYLELGFLGLALIVAGTVPAAITTQLPHANRAFLALPGFLLLASGGLALWRYVWPVNRRAKIWIWPYLLLILAVLGVLPWWQNYRQVFAPVVGVSSQIAAAPPAQGVLNPYALDRRQAASDYLFATNLLDALKQAWQQESVRQIVVSTGLEHEYIYALLAGGVKPQSWMSEGALNKFLFVERIKANDFERPQTILIFTPDHLEAPRLSEGNGRMTNYYGATGQANLFLYQTAD
jgi:GT2 family glycosyltransferase